MFKMMLRSTVPVAFGYLPLGFAFGVLWSELGYSWVYALLFSVFVYAGAAQFMVIGLLKSGSSLFDIFFLTLMLNLRHVFYGVSFLHLYRPLNIKNLYLISALTDETYSLLTSIATPRERQHQYAFWVSAIDHLYWIVGCTAGAILGQHAKFSAPELEFALPCLFVVLAVEQIRAKRRLGFCLVALSAVIIGIGLGGNTILLVAICLSVAYLIFAGRRERWEH